MFNFFGKKEEEEQKFETNNSHEEESLIDTTLTNASNKAIDLAEKSEVMKATDYKMAAGFLFASFIFFFLALTSLPLVLIRPASFNLYFCFGSMFLQMSLAFYFSPVEYLKKLFSSENRFVSIVYLISLGLSLYMVFIANTSYLMALGMFFFQTASLVWLTTVAVKGADTANGFMY